VTAAHQSAGRAHTSSSSALSLALVAWLIPGAGHVLHGDLRRGGILFVTLTAMFALGIAFGGRLFPFQLSEWLVFLAAVAQWGAGVPRVIAGLAGVADGDVIAITYEYGNTFLMASGLLNALVVLDVYDRARGLKGTGGR
jgi:nucleoside recognition membrane protein YjiH